MVYWHHEVVHVRCFALFAIPIRVISRIYVSLYASATPNFVYIPQPHTSIHHKHTSLLNLLLVRRRRNVRGLTRV